MAYKCYDKLWRSELYNNISPKDSVQDINLDQLKLKLNDTYKKDEKKTKKRPCNDGDVAPCNDGDVVNKAYLDIKLSEIENNISFIEKDYKELKLLSNKQSMEEILTERAVKTSIQTLYDEGLFYNYDKADEVLKYYLFVQRRRSDLDTKPTQ